jgi:multicomponent Na+:H+ antiporter subunit D
LPFETGYWPYDPTHVLTQTQLLFFGALAFVGLQKTGIYPAELRSVNIDVEWSYRWLAPRIVGAVAPVMTSMSRRLWGVTLFPIRAFQGLAPRIYGPRQWPTGNMVIWVTVMLAAYLVLHIL